MNKAPRLLPDDSSPFRDHATTASLVVLLPRTALPGSEGDVKSFECHESLGFVAQTLGPVGVDLNACLRHFSAPETLTGDERVDCSQCKSKQDGTKVLTLWKAPPVLTVHLKRFKTRGFPGALEYLSKIDTSVDYPLEGLDLSTFLQGPQNPDCPPVYDLFAVSEHSGSFSFGHYTARIKNFRNGKWYLMNDEYASPCKPEDAINSFGYVLFYKLREMGRGGSGSVMHGGGVSEYGGDGSEHGGGSVGEPEGGSWV